MLATVAAATPRTAPVRSLLEIRRDNVVMQQWDISCGAAALATILTYQLDDPVSEKEVALGMLRRTDPLRVKYRGGFSLLDMKRYAQRRGFDANGFGQLTLDNLRELAPLIVPLHLDGYDHFIVFRGVADGRAVFADPAFGNRTLPLAAFEQAWNGGIGFVVGPQQPPAGANHLAPEETDVLTVASEAVRTVLVGALPQPLADWQMRDLPLSAKAERAMKSRAEPDLLDVISSEEPVVIPTGRNRWLMISTGQPTPSADSAPTSYPLMPSLDVLTMRSRGSQATLVREPLVAPARASPVADPALRLLPSAGIARHAAPPPAAPRLLAPVTRVIRSNHR